MVIRVWEEVKKLSRRERVGLLSNLPRKFVRAIDSSLQGSCYLPRAAVQPPESLVRDLWPWVDEWMEWYEQGLGQ